jgi:hypothetical protein
VKKTEYRTLVGVIDAYLRHEPHRFGEAAAWVLSQRSPAPTAARRTVRRHGYSGLALRTFECMWDIADHYRQQLHGPSAPSPSSHPLDEVEAFRVLLVAWLLSPSTALVCMDRRLRPTDMGPLPFLDAEQTLRITDKFLLPASPKWKALVRAAWNLVGDVAYLDEHKDVAAPPLRPVTADSPNPKKKRRLRRSEALGYVSYLLILHSDLPLVGEGKTTYSREQFEHLQRHGSPVYEAAGVPFPDDYKRWSTYVRKGIAYFASRGDESPQWSELAGILKLNPTALRNLSGTNRNS